MAFDKPTRNRLASFVAEARSLIVAEFTEQFQSLFGISAKGDLTPLDKLGHLDDVGLATAALLRERIDYLEKTHPDDKDGRKAAVARLAREQAFTILNRLAAIRMAEKRGIIVESVGQGYQSRGFKVFEQVAGSGLGDTYHRYRRYLFCLFDELAIDLGILFDRRSPQALLFPLEPVLLALLDILHAAHLEPLWAEDETIGWIYQYYNDPEERKKMRKESAAPRNSRELAVRNQFFTPRYVVEFLTDNTLGRTWYEMTKGETSLADQCRYLVRRPTEIFLVEGEEAPQVSKQEGLSQEELLKQPVHIPHRPLKDPREIRLLDPACGSMHFGLYAFDLFETIYKESWDDGSCPALQEIYASRDEFLRDVPRLIIEYNIHGIDIDPRAVQIAGLSLWLRAQKAWQGQGVKPADRPCVRRSNIVCAEPMPGSPEMLEDFMKTLAPPLLGELVKTIFVRLQLAGEAGSLLKIEEEIRTAIDTARKAWEKIDSKPRQLFLTKEHNQFSKVPELTGLEKALTTGRRNLTPEFWDTAEQQVIDALRAYAEQADADSYQRRLFADDAARGFAFIDLCRKRYDAVLMNPPFGKTTPPTFRALEVAYPDTFLELYAAFVSRGYEILADGGKVGAITSRAFLTINRLENWRRTEVVDAIELILDLGGGVMDSAMVESTAYIMGRGVIPSHVSASDIRPMGWENRENWLSCDAVKSFIVSRSQFKRLPRTKILYAIPSSIFEVLESTSHFEPNIGTVRQGMGTFNDFRFIHLRWEVPFHELGRGRVWEPLTKGGAYFKYYADIHLVLNWSNNGAELSEVNKQHNGQDAQVRQASEYWRRAGSTYSKRSQKGFSARALPAGCILTGKGPAILSESSVGAPYILGWVNSRLIEFLIEMQANFGEYNTGILKRLPWVDCEKDCSALELETKSLICSIRELISCRDESNTLFLMPQLGVSLSEMSLDYQAKAERASDATLKLQERWNSFIDNLYGVDSSFAESESEDEEEGDTPPTVVGSDNSSLFGDLLSYCCGICLGRWDIRYPTGERQPPELPDPFDPLPVCPPGMLQNAGDLPAEPKDVPSDYPLRISWPGILADDENHPEDMVVRLRETIEVVWKDRAEAIEQEACEILGVKTLRDYIRRPAAFFADHLKRYSKSRRQAPIYWPLSTKSGSYTLWLYYHRLTDQTLHTCLADFLEPKLKKVQSELGALSTSGQGGSRAGELREFLDELHDLRDEIERIIKLPWKPNLNDGVLITASPLHKLFRLPKWQKDLKACWDNLANGDYDWAHLAYSIWPKRVEEACKKDRSIAIAHNLDHLCQVQPPKPKAKRRKKNASIDFVEGE